MMGRRRLGGSLLLLLLVNPLALISKDLIRVDETKTRLLTTEHDSVLKLAVVTDSPRDLPVHIEVEVLDTDDNVLEKVVRDFASASKSRQLEIPFRTSFSQTESQNDSDSLWRRVRYRVTATEPGQAPAEARGVISVSELSSEPFALRVAAPVNVIEGRRCRLVVFTQHPSSGRPIANVDIAGALMISADAGDRVLKAAARSNSSGYATLEFEIPSDLDDPDITFQLKARLGGFVKEIHDDLRLVDLAQILLSTDKPIYQPGQHLRIRVLAFDASKHAVVQAPVTVVIKDPEFATVYQTESMTSQFGEADADWTIPDNVRLGDYEVEVRLRDRSEPTSHRVKISRYDLPEFTVGYKPDRSYYLPDQNAQVEIRADYLFGQPVKQGHVRVVQETRRHWDYRAQKWDTDEAHVVEGELDAQGRFTAAVDLQEEHDRLASHNYERYSDIHYAAYVTDASTNRTEQRRFDIRLSKEPIHVYVREHDNAFGFPIEFYVSTFYADGSPAKTRVSIYEFAEPTTRGRAPSEDTAQLLRVIRTNRYGVAKVTGLSSNNDTLLLTAEDGKGGHGRHTEELSLRNAAIRVYTNKSIYRSGEPLEVEVRSTFDKGPVLLQVLRADKVLQSTVLRLNNGKAFTVIPFSADFKDDITIGTYYAGSRETQIFASRNVVYPRNRELNIDARFNQAAYAPGDEASVAFRVRTPDGVAKASLLGVVVLDKAIEERARTDSDFGRGYWYCDACSRWLGADGDVGGLTRRDLDHLDLTEPVPPDLDVAAEILLSSSFYSAFYPKLVDDDDVEAARAFEHSIERHLAALKVKLDERFRDGGAHPTNEAALKELLSASGANFESFRDPWDNPYRPSFSVERGFDVMRLQSAGPDKRFGSTDDFTALTLRWPYFKVHGDILDQIVRDYHERTGKFIRDLSTLKSELMALGENVESWKDRWDRPYRFEFSVARSRFVVTVRSSGPNTTFESSDEYRSDDFPIWNSSIDYTQGVRNTLDRVVSGFYQETTIFPETPEQFDEAVRRSGTLETDLIDPWMHRYYPTFRTGQYYSDLITISTYEDHLRQSSQRTSHVPVTSKIQFLVLRSAGPDGQEGTFDDFDVATVSRVMAQQSAKDATPQTDTNAPVLQGLTGAIQGLVTDVTGAAIPGVRIAATSTTQVTFEATSDDSGMYLLRNLPVGQYDVAFQLPGFMQTIIQKVVVQSSLTAGLNVTLQVGGIAQSVEVSVAASPGLATSTSLAVLSAQKNSSEKTAPPLSTPRLRNYFPETLVWQPALETDRSGRAQVKFKLADNITTWKMAAIVSTTDGQIGVVEKELISSQPFFVEHDPPKILTQGDEIALPVILRSYLDKDQTIELSMKEGNWFAPLSDSTKNIAIKSGDTLRETFGFKALTPIKDGRQRVTAKGSRASDSIEKPVTVHPDGEEINHVSTELFRSTTTHSLVISPEAIPNSMHAELRIYPNLLAHLVDGIEGILQRPYGCAEQTISSAYPSLMLLRYYKKSGDAPAGLASKARRYLQTGVDHLRAYQTSDGGFSYWGRGDADVAVTAYAVRFLHDAGEIVSVDEDGVRRAYEWLEKHQQEDGSWNSNDVLTAFVARVLSEPSLHEVISRRRANVQQNRDPVVDAITYLRGRIEQLAEPYTLASLGLAASNTGDAELLRFVTSELERTSHTERDGTYWDLQANTPFYGWGFAGRIETTALVVRALTNARKPASTDSDPLINQALLFLLRSKDRYGVWYSTQATVNVLDALMALLGNPEETAGPSHTDITINGRVVASVSIPTNNRLVAPIVVDLSPFVTNGANTIEIRAASSVTATAQFVETYYVPWKSDLETVAKVPADSASALRLSVRFDKTNPQVGEQIVCKVETERRGFRGYGMMVAEIGLPPGAEVDRASLEDAIKAGQWDLYRYDVLPDRLIAYVWPRAGGTEFNFKLRLRYGINAQTPASTLYDYYNPDAQTTVRPVRFDVR